jgi:MFS family permease
MEHPILTNETNFNLDLEPVPLEDKIQDHPLLREEDEEPLDLEIRLVRSRNFVKRKLDDVKQYGLRVWRVCGWRFILFLIVSQFAGKGLLMTLVERIMLPLFKEHVGAALLQQYVMATMLPWSLKPVVGICADYILIFGFRKRGWLLVSLLLGCVGAALLFFVTQIGLLVVGFVLLNVELSVYDLLTEAKYSELRKKYPSTGSDLTTLAQGMQTVGVLLGSIIIGPLADRALYTVLFAIILALAILPLAPTVLGWLSEKRVSNAKPISCFNGAQLREEWPLVCLVVCSGFAGLLVSLLVTTASSPLIGLGLAIGFLVAILIGAVKFFDGLMSSIALYQVLVTVSQPSIGTYLDFFYTANATCLPNGPHFDWTYYMTYAGTVGNITALISVIIYQVLFSKLRFRPVLLITTVLIAIASASDLVIVMRWNVALGISDRIAYMIGEAVLEPAIYAMNWIPVSALIALASPKGKEATCFAFLAGVSNFARMVAELSGSVIIETVTDGNNCDFGALWWTVLLCHIALPVIIGVAAVFLIPDIRQDEAVQNEDH